MSDPLISAIVLFHNQRSALEAAACVRALKGQTIADNLEVIVVNNNADPAAVRSFSDSTKDQKILSIHTGANLGYGRGNNLGAKSAQGKYLLIINPDNRLEPNALATMMKYLEERDGVGVVGPKLVFPDSSVRDSYRSFPKPLDVIIKRTPLQHFFQGRMKTYLQWDQNPDAIRDVDWMCGACILLRRKLYEELGGFDERFFLFFEDCDRCRTIGEKGFRVVYLPTAVAHDNEQRLSAGGILSFFTKKTVRVHTISAIKYFWKWRGKPLPREQK